MEKKTVYPHMVVCYMAAVYQFQPISILPHNPDYRWTGAALAQNLVAVAPAKGDDEIRDLLTALDQDCETYEVEAEDTDER